MVLVVLELEGSHQSSQGKKLSLQNEAYGTTLAVQQTKAQHYFQISAEQSNCGTAPRVKQARGSVYDVQQNEAYGIGRLNPATATF